MTNFNVTKNLYELVAELSRLLVGAEQHKLVTETFPNYFKLWMKETTPEKPIATSIENFLYRNITFVKKASQQPMMDLIDFKILDSKRPYYF